MILVKLGGSLITDKSTPFTVRMEVIKRLAGEIHEARQEKDFKLILGHGSGSYGHPLAKEFNTHKGFIRADSQYGFAKVHHIAAQLNNIVVEALINRGENAVAVSPTAVCLAKNGKIIDFHTKPLEYLLDANMLPVVYGDVGIDMEKGCCILSGEEILNTLAIKWGANRIIMVGKTGGVYTADPNLDPAAQHIKRIDLQNFDVIKQYLTDSDGIDVTGGMLLKVGRAVEVSKKGIETEIINGNQAGYLKMSLLGKKNLGTVITNRLPHQNI